jgi:hypothetical protein
MGDKTQGGEGEVKKNFGEKNKNRLVQRTKNKIRKDRITYVDKSTTRVRQG